jgi:hypothetical protein
MAGAPLAPREHRPHQPSEGNPEQEPIPYHRAARLRGKRPAGEAYVQAQDAIYGTPVCDLSVYRFHINRIWHVAALGELPPEDLAQKLQEILSTGEATALPPQVLKLLIERRNQAMREGPYVERHYRPGQQL